MKHLTAAASADALTSSFFILLFLICMFFSKINFFPKVEQNTFVIEIGTGEGIVDCPVLDVVNNRRRYAKKVDSRTVGVV